FDKYKGGLDTVHDLTGTESVYTAWKNIEIMFHVSTMLPHEEHDPQKRHIGNDIVCVVSWKQRIRLLPACIKSHFLHAFIVVRASPAAPSGTPTVYEVSVVSRDEVGAYKPYLWHRSVFPKGTLFREWLLTKIVNGERTSYSAPKFARMQDRTRSQMLEDMVTNLQNHAETGQIPKPYRRGSWRPIGHMRPSSPLLDSVRDPFEGYDQLARDFAKMFQSTRQLCDVVFNVAAAESLLSRSHSVADYRNKHSGGAALCTSVASTHTSGATRYVKGPAAELHEQFVCDSTFSKHIILKPFACAYEIRTLRRTLETRYRLCACLLLLDLSVYFYMRNYFHSVFRTPQCSSIFSSFIRKKLVMKQTILFLLLLNVLLAGKEKTKVYAVRAILAVRSRVFLEMLYGFSTGFGLSSSGPGDSSSRVLSPSTAKSSGNFLQARGNVPDIHDAPRNKSAPSSPMVIRAFSRLGNWTGWSSRTSSKDPLIPDIGGLKRWQSDERLVPGKEKEKERNTVMAGTTVTLSVCADAHKVDRAKLCQHEFNIIEFDSDTFQLLVDYLHCGSCPLTCEAIPALICAAEHFDLPELLQACFHHAKTHLRLSVVCAMLNVLDNYYWRYTSATELVNMILQFVDTRAVALFSRQEFLELSESMFQSIIGRELNIPEVYKFEIMLRWATHHVTTVTRPGKLRLVELQCTMSRLTRELKLHLIPPQELIKVVLPTRTISHEQILETLLYQADTGMFRV
ncbi:rap GTPase-activating protein, putative, partial [Ixodes scapularis]